MSANYWLLCIILSIRGFPSFAQLPTINPYITAGDQTTSVSVFDIRQPGTYYYDTKWNTGHIYLNSGDSLVGYYVRYDLIRNHLEVLWDDRKVGIYGTNISGFSWFDPTVQDVRSFVSKLQFQFSDDTEVATFLEILQDGEVTLLKSKTVISRYQATSPSVVQDNYSSETNILSDYFLARGKEVFHVSGRKKTLTFLSSDKLEEYVREENLNFRIEDQLIQIIAYYNASCIATN